MTKFYHQMMSETEIGSGTIEAVRELITKVWRGSTESRLEAVRACCETICHAYGIERIPRIEFVSGTEGNALYAVSGGGVYDSRINAIHLFKKVSLVTFLHELRHAMQHILELEVNREKDARAWSLSAYYIADPIRFQRAVDKGILRFV